MRFMMLVKASPSMEQQPKPSAEAFAAMGKYNQSLRDAGVLLALDGLGPTSDAVKVTFPGGKPTVKDGPFTEATELVGGFWIIQVRSKEEAVEWAKRVPFMNGEWVEIRRIMDLADYADVMEPDHLERRKSFETDMYGKAN